MTIWKYPVPITDDFTISMPKGAEVLSVQTPHGSPQIWCLVNPEWPVSERKFKLVGTGHPINGQGVGRFVGTFQMQLGALVFHLFEMS